ncbi:MAG: DUF1015 family protein [Bacteroidetes bacterium]|nr:DUF1015 family protein [Bacteroidota bacterium]MBU1423231.1 DUF1015 family protein [Bacteroidota bacterium]MBU2470862.1 DUF1015 family protein [Bacteroidota bacterium]
MSTLRPFKGYRPLSQYAAEVAAKPYDILNSEEARIEASGHPHSFLHVGKPEIDLDPSISLYDTRVYEMGEKNLQKMIDCGVLQSDPQPFLYLYSQTMGTHTQYGIVGCVSVQEYLNNIIKKHELTRKDKEGDRTKHVKYTNAHTGPIFLTYHAHKEVDKIVDGITASMSVYDFVASDGIRHRFWIIPDPTLINQISKIFQSIPYLYIADGHHRAASAAHVGVEMASKNPNHTGEEEYNFFLAVLFPHNQLKILDYNRVVKTLNNRTSEKLINEIQKKFDVSEVSGQAKPAQKGEFGMYLNKKWYYLRVKPRFTPIKSGFIGVKPEIACGGDIIDKLDVSILQNHILQPLLGIDDPRTSKNIDFVGGIRGLGELEQRVDSGEMAVAFALFPTSIEELMSIADAGKIMPPKSTWFEPKLRDGLVIHFLI